MSESTMRDVLVRLEEQEAELRALRRRLEGPPEARSGRARTPRTSRRTTGRRRLALAAVFASDRASPSSGELASLFVPLLIGGGAAAFLLAFRGLADVLAARRP